MVQVGDPGNTADTTGFGAVAYPYLIGKFEVTNTAYTAFLNSVAAADPNSLYDTRMGTHVQGGITRNGTSGNFTYATKLGMENKPVAFVSWFDAARFANWCANGQPVAAQSNATTENGVYPLNNLAAGIIQKNLTNPNTAQAPFRWIAAEDEWHKAAYYKGNGTASGYWEFPTQSNTSPGNLLGSSANMANHHKLVYSITQNATFSASQLYLGNVGSYTASPSAYGTFDQGGNLQEWTDGINQTTNRVLRGGSWTVSSNLTKSSRAFSLPSASGDEFTGFRLAGSIPQTISIILPTTGLPQGGWGDFYEYQLNVLGGLAPFTWQVLTGALPDGLQLTADGRITGIPLQSGAFTFTVQVTDSLGNKAILQMTLVIAPASNKPSVNLGSGIDSGGGLSTVGELHHWSSMGYPIQTIRATSGNTTIQPGFLRTLLQLQTKPQTNQ
jgi:sulfatase modifying factor 1